MGVAMSSAQEVDFLQGRPAKGPGHYLRDVVLGANDGVVTTMAIVAATAGASLSPLVALVLGVANLIADGFSMGMGSYVSIKSELHQRGVEVRLERPGRHGIATFVAFALVGSIPLLAYAVPGVGPAARFASALVLAAVALALVGIWRAPFVRVSRASSAFEVLAVGAIATGAAYAVGALARWAMLP